MIKTTSSISQVVIPSLNLIPQKKTMMRQNSQTGAKIKSVGDRNDFPITTILLDQTTKPISYRQNSQNKQDLTKSTNFQSSNCTPKGQDKGENSRQQQYQSGKHHYEQRQYSLDQQNFAAIDLNSNAINGKYLPIKCKESLPNKSQCTTSNQNFFRLRQTPNWFCQKVNVQPKSEKQMEKKEFIQKKLTEASTPKCRGNSNDKAIQPIMRLDTIAKQMSQENQQNPFSINHNNNQYLTNAHSCSNNQGGIFSHNNTSRQNYFQINQKKNELLKTKIAMNLQQESLQQKFIEMKPKNPHKINNIYQNDYDPGMKKKTEESQKLMNKQQYYQQQVLQLQQQLHQLPSMRQIGYNDKNDNKQLQKLSQKFQATSLSPNRIEMPAQHLQKDGDEMKGYNKGNNQGKQYFLQRQCSHQQINSMTSHTINQAMQRAKYFDNRSQSKDSSRNLKPAKTLDPEQLMGISNIFEEEEPLYSSGNRDLISPLIKQQYCLSPPHKQIGSSQQSFDQIKIWQSSEKSNCPSSGDNLKNIKPIIRQAKHSEEDKRDEFVKLYTKRYKNYPQVSPTSKSMNDQEIKSLVFDIFFNQKRNSSHTSIEEEEQEKQYSQQYQSTASGQTYQSTPKTQKQNNVSSQDKNIAYQVAMMPITSSGSSHSATNGYLSHDSTPIQQKINSIFISDDKQKREKYHKEFIKCFFQEPKNKM